MDTLFERFYQKIDYIKLDFIRSIKENIHWESRLIGIKGPRGVGKTTLLLQYIKQNLAIDETVLYVSLDNIWFSENKLLNLVDKFTKRGGKFLFLDEVHKYPNWSQELKNIYDDYPQLHVVFTGSSLLEILNARADLSRRATIYHMQGLSFREYLNMNHGTSFKRITLEEILQNHTQLSREIVSQIKPIRYFTEYLKTGYYPFYNELPALYYSRIEEVINMMLEIELPLLRGVDIGYIPRIKQILQIIAESVPFIPNVSKLSEKIGINRTTFLAYLHYLQEVKVTQNLFKDSSGISKLQKPDKIFLENTNLCYTLAGNNANTGNLRETFFVNQVSYLHQVTFSDRSDFLVDEKYTFEIGGKGKTNKQIEDIPNAFLSIDDIEHGYGNRIPLWLFGFLY